MRRFGQVIGLDPDRLDEYRSYHAEVWPEIAQALRDAGIRNYTIYYRDGQLFGTFEYHGPDEEWDARQRALAEAPRMQEWWEIMGSMQRPDPDRPPGAWWSDLEEVFHFSE